MSNIYAGNADTVKDALAADHIKYGISIGRRAPMHIMHVDCIKEISEAGLKPVVLIGSVNGPQSKFYDPLRNPMTEAQQKIQLKAAIPTLDVNRYVVTLDDVGDDKKWSDKLQEVVLRNGLEGKSVAHFRTKAADASVIGAIKPLSAYAQHFAERGLPVWESRNREPHHDDISASDLRVMDLEHLTPEQHALFAAPDYIIQLAKDARDHNPGKTELEAHHIPITMLDLTFDRLRSEAGIDTASIIRAAQAQGEVTLNSLIAATEASIEQLHALHAIPADRDEVLIKAASASVNQTIVNFTRNIPNITTAIDKAVKDKADILSLQELVLTGYTGDDNFKWIRTEKQQKELIEQLQYLAEYANERDPNLVLSVGFPFFYADKHQPVKVNLGTEENPILVPNPLYNIDNKPFNAVAIISGGKIHAISAKAIQPEGSGEFEGRQFQTWPDYLGASEVTLYNGQKVPFGKVVAELGDGKGKRMTFYHEICAEAWGGISPDGTVNLKEMHQGRYLAQLAKKHDISLVINPSASKPEPFIDKTEARKKVCTTASELTRGGGAIYSNPEGLEAAPIAFEGGCFFANKGEIIHQGERYNMGDVVYSSATMHVPVPQKGKAHVVIPHVFHHHKMKMVGGPAAWESHVGEQREHEEIMRNTTLWLRDYLKKTGQQGYFISLSGGQDSAFGAVAITQMIDLNISQLEHSLGSKEKAVIAFVDQFDGLKYADDVKKTVKKHGAEAGIDFLKSKMLTCAYFPSENSSRDTRDAARFLIEGGVAIDIKLEEGEDKRVFFDKEKDRIEGNTLFYKSDDGEIHAYEIVQKHEAVKGIGGTFHIMPVQEVIDAYIEIYSGVDKAGLTPEQKERLQKEIKEVVQGDRKAVSNEFKDRVGRRVPTWKDPRDDLTLQNIQARARLPLAWLFGNDENKIACVTSNWSEAVAGYWTFGGDGHMGSLNVLGGVPKSVVRRILPYLEKDGLTGLTSIPALSLVNDNKASAELRPLDKNGKIIQYDENDMMPYDVLDAIAKKLFVYKNSPFEAYKQLWDEQPTFSGTDVPLFANKRDLVAAIDQCCWRWDASQFKRVASVIHPFLGDNVDPHTSIRTTILSHMFKNGRVQLKLEYLKDELGGEQEFEKTYDKKFAGVYGVINTALRTKPLFETILKTKWDALKETLDTYYTQSQTRSHA